MAEGGTGLVPSGSRVDASHSQICVYVKRAGGTRRTHLSSTRSVSTAESPQTSALRSP
jgi:hypothetical protein